MVVTQEKRATRIGLDILERGGNAVDAAVAVGFALAVTLPKAGNLGGGGFMLVHLAGQDRDKDRDKAGDFAVDYREAAPRHHPTSSSTTMATQTRRRATAGLPSACPAPSPGCRLRSSASARGSSRSPT
jgi:gamma-glutamyltranspeptidase/glutathione hydrolase